MSSKKRADFCSYVDQEGWLDIERFIGQSWKTVPCYLREVGEGVVQVSSLNAVIRDYACDPRSGGIAGDRHISRIYDVSAQHFRRNIAPELEYLREWGGIPLTNFASAEADARRYRNEVNERRSRNLRQNQTRVSSSYPEV